MTQVPTFKVLAPEDCLLLHQWLLLPHVRAFWDDGLKTEAEVRDYYFQAKAVSRFLFFINEESAGYIQTYRITPQDPYGAFTLEVGETYGLDFFIGNAKFLNQGLAVTVLREFISRHCQTATRVIVDPEPRNKKALHVYEKFGFIKVGACKRADKDHELMAIDL